MIYEFTVENFRSFGAAQTLSLIKGKEQNKPENCFVPVSGFPQVVRATAIFGHNASGKSNLAQALQVFLQTVQFSAIAFGPDAPIPGVVPHKFSSKWEGKPTRFEIIFATDQRVLRYSFSTFPEQISSESLHEELKAGKSRELFARGRQKSDGTADIRFSKDFDAAACDAVTKFTRANALALSSGANFNVPLLREAYSCLTTRLRFAGFGPGGLVFPSLAKDILNNADFRQQLGNLVQDADFGITGFRASPAQEPSVQEVEQWRKVFAPTYGDRAAEMATEHIKNQKLPQIFVQHAGENAATLELPWAEESQGTQLFAQLIWVFKDVARSGATLVIDEFGSSIHPLLSARLIELAQVPANHSKGGQLIFTTHQTQLMSPVLFRKDQIWIMQKSPHGETELFSLADFRSDKYTRSTEAFEKNYLVGRYGGIGNFGPTLSGRSVDVADAPGSEG